MKLRFFVLLMSFAIKGISQQHQTFLPPVTGNAPNVASLNKYGDYEVSHFTGVPNISIPLYNIKVNGMEVPIVLTYHASGIRVHDVSSWVGAGWSLQVGGQISRKIMGAPDEFTDNYLDEPLKEYSDINDGPSDATQLYFYSILAQSADVEPDIFSYNFPGNSGRFFFDKDDNYNAALIPFSPLKISKERFGLNNDTLAFKILDTKGNQFVFGYHNRDLSSSNSTYTANSAWMLEEMISADKIDTIYFSYSTQIAIPTVEPTSSISIRDNPESAGQWPTTLVSEIFPSTDGASMTTSVENLNKQIIFRGGKIEFELSSASREDGSGGSAKSLKKISIFSHQNGSYQLIKVIDFSQSYFTNGPKRLRLDAVNVKDKTSTNVEVYQFDYDNSALVANANRAWDLWGYYNGKNNSSLIPRMEIPYKSGVNTPVTNIWIGSDISNGRDPDPAQTQKWVLNKITYPTGGYTIFEYENNKYSENGTLYLCGGLRIKTIKSYTAVGAAPIVKTYTYGQNESGGGRKNFVLNNHLLTDNKTYEEYRIVNLFPVFNNSIRVRTYHSNPVYNIESFGENSVVYPNVVEYVGTPATNEGKIVYEYRDYPDLTVTIEYLKPRTVSYAFDRGQISNKKLFKKTSTGYQIVKEEAYDYSAFPLKNYGAVGLVVNKKKYQFSMDSGAELNFEYPSPFLSGLWEFSYYPIVSDDNYLTSKIVKDYDQEDVTKFTTTTTTYAYNNLKHQQVNELVFVNSAGEIIKQKNRYPADYLIGTNTTTGNTVLDNMMTKNIIAAPIETWSTFTQSGTEKTTSGLLNIYKKLGTNAIVADRKMQLELANPVTDFAPSSISSTVLQKDSRYSDQVVFDSYDAKNNPAQMTPRNAPTNAYIWDYNLSYPVAEAVGAGQNEIAYTSFEADGTGTWVYTDVGRPQVSGGVTGKRYLSLNSRDGNTISRENLTIGKTYVVSYWSESTSALIVTGGTSSHQAGETINGWTFHRHTVTAAATTITLTGSYHIDEIRLHPATAKMTTYTYDPLIGMTSQCDINNKITYYEYDSFGRLRNILDQDRNVLKTYDYRYQQNINQ